MFWVTPFTFPSSFDFFLLHQNLKYEPLVVCYFQYHCFFKVTYVSGECLSGLKPVPLLALLAKTVVIRNFLWPSATFLWWSKNWSSMAHLALTNALPCWGIIKLWHTTACSLAKAIWWSQIMAYHGLQPGQGRLMESNHK